MLYVRFQLPANRSCRTIGIYSCVQPDDALSGHERPRDFIRVPIAIMDPQIRNVHVYALIVAHA